MIKFAKSCCKLQSVATSKRQALHYRQANLVQAALDAMRRHIQQDKHLTLVGLIVQSKSVSNTCRLHDMDMVGKVSAQDLDKDSVLVQRADLDLVQRADLALRQLATSGISASLSFSRT